MVDCIVMTGGYCLATVCVCKRERTSEQVCPAVSDFRQGSTLFLSLQVRVISCSYTGDNAVLECSPSKNGVKTCRQRNAFRQNNRTLLASAYLGLTGYAVLSLYLLSLSSITFPPLSECTPSSRPSKVPRHNPQQKDISPNAQLRVFKALLGRYKLVDIRSHDLLQSYVSVSDKRFLFSDQTQAFLTPTSTEIWWIYKQDWISTPNDQTTSLLKFHSTMTA